MILTQLFRIAGVTNTITYDDGLKSTEKEKKRLLYIRGVVDEIAGNDIQGYHERTKVFDIPDRLMDEETSTGTINKAKPGARINEIEVGLEIPVGEVFKAAIRCGATATDFHGFYAYELIT